VPGCLFNSSIADELKPYAFSVIAALLVCSAWSARDPENMGVIPYKIEIRFAAAL
jgi:hypothetical protein